MARSNKLILELPTHITQWKGRGKDKALFDYPINLNHYRNWHWKVESSIKKRYCAKMKDALEILGNLGKISLKFVLVPYDKKARDRANILSISEKYFCDAMVHYGNLEDDNDEFIESTNYLTRYNYDIDEVRNEKSKKNDAGVQINYRVFVEICFVTNGNPVIIKKQLHDYL